MKRYLEGKMGFQVSFSVLEELSYNAGRVLYVS